MNITIANVRDFLVPNPAGKGKRAVFPDEAHVWVGRAAPRWGLKASPLRNPFRKKGSMLVSSAGHPRMSERPVKPAYPPTLEHIVGHYRSWLRQRIREEHPSIQLRELDRLRALHEKQDLTLICCCETWNGEGEAPGLCHAEVVREELLRGAT